MSTSRRPTTSTKSADSRPSAPRRIELLAPAKDKHCGVEAILHGADAVYIGAELFSARAAAGNSLADIAELAAFAHFYRAKVYVALNTLLTDAELPQACALAFELARAGADALIVQDMGLVYSLMQYALNLPEHRFPLPLHASTQMDNRTAGKAAFLQACGMEQVVLARELSLENYAKYLEIDVYPLQGMNPDVYTVCVTAKADISDLSITVQVNFSNVFTEEKFSDTVTLSGDFAKDDSAERQIDLPSVMLRGSVSVVSVSGGLA